MHLIRGGKHLFHLHMVEPASDFFRDQLLFRDHLRNHPEDARAYAALKLELAQKFRQDREAYTDGKSGFILGILAREKIQDDQFLESMENKMGLEDFQNKQYMNIETFRKSSEGVRTPVWFVEHNGELCFTTEGVLQK